MGRFYVQLSYQQNSVVSSYTWHNFFLLFTAIENNNIEIVKLLLDAGADPNIETFKSTTALHAAAEVVSVEGCLTLSCENKRKLLGFIVLQLYIFSIIFPWIIMFWVEKRLRAFIFSI